MTIEKGEAVVIKISVSSLSFCFVTYYTLSINNFVIIANNCNSYFSVITRIIIKICNTITAASKICLLETVQRNYKHCIL